MKSKVIFLDRDGTINKDTHYLYRKDDFEFLSGVKEALLSFQTAGFKLIVITNQSGIARGMYSEGDYALLNEWMISELKKDGISIAASYYCSHLPYAVIEKYRIDCDCRKPKLGLFKKAMADFGIDESASWAIGDKMRDLAICEHSAVRGVLLYSGKEERAGNIFSIKGGLDEAAQKIIGGAFK